MGDLIEFDSQPLRNFEANLDLITNFITEHKNYNIIIATDYPERVKEILKEKEIFFPEFAESIILGGCILEDFKTIIMTDRELFNKRSKEVTSTKNHIIKKNLNILKILMTSKLENMLFIQFMGLGFTKDFPSKKLTDS